jgi:hypothetical protein
MPEIKALIDIMSFGFPYQYNQKPIMTKLFYLNFAFRLLLNKFLPRVFNKPAFFMIQDHTLSYTEVLKKCNATTRRIKLLLMSVLSYLSYLVLYLFKIKPKF